MCSFAWLLTVLFAYPFLTAGKAVEADILVVEGWQSNEALAKAAREFRSGGYQTLITTGGRMMSSKYLKQHHELRYTMKSGGFPKGAELLINGSGIDYASFELSMCGSDGWETKVTGQPQHFTYEIPCEAASISIMSKNSREVDPETQNLFIKYVLIDWRNILSMDVTAERWVWQAVEGNGPMVGTGTLLITDHATKSRNELVALGIPEEQIMIAPGGGNGMHRTRQNANGLKRAIDREGLTGRAMNLFTTGIHARRSRMLYEQALGQEMGVVVAKDPRVSPFWWWLSPKNWWRVLKELAGCLYYQFA